MKRTQQTGFAHLALVLLLLVLAVAAFSGYTVYKNHQNKVASNQTSTSLTAPAQTIKSSADLDTATQTLNSQSVDSDLNPDQLNSDISSLL